MKLRWSRRAQQDLLEIGRFIAKDKRAVARKWVERLRRRARQAAKFPNSGRVVPEYSRPELREILLQNYRIVYQVGEGAVEILTVFEGHLLFPADSIADSDE